MRKSDLVRSALGGLWRQKARTSLTLLGVAVGSCALAFSLSLGIGLRGLIDNEFKSREDFWWVTVFPANRGRPIIEEKDIPREKIEVKGEMSEACLGLGPKGWAYVASLIKDGRVTDVHVYADEPYPQLADKPPIVVASSFSLSSLFK